MKRTTARTLTAGARWLNLQADEQRRLQRITLRARQIQAQDKCRWSVALRQAMSIASDNTYLGHFITKEIE